MVFVDDKGLEEQFLTEDEDTANVLDTSANCAQQQWIQFQKTKVSNKHRRRSLTYNLPGDLERKA